MTIKRKPYKRYTKEFKLEAIRKSCSAQARPLPRSPAYWVIQIPRTLPAPSGALPVSARVNMSGNISMGSCSKMTTE